MRVSPKQRIAYHRRFNAEEKKLQSSSQRSKLQDQLK